MGEEGERNRALPLERRRVAPRVTTRRGRAGRGGHALSRARAAERDRCRVPAPRAGPRRRLPQAGSGGAGTAREADPAGLEPGRAMGAGAGRPGVLAALLFAVCAPLRLQAEELGE